MDSNNKITAAIFSFNNNITEKIISNLRETELVKEIIIISDYEIGDNISLVKSNHPFGGETIRKVIEQVSTKYLIFIIGNRVIEIKGDGVEKFISEAEKANTGWIYSDYNEKRRGKSSPIH